MKNILIALLVIISIQSSAQFNEKVIDGKFLSFDKNNYELLISSDEANKTNFIEKHKRDLGFNSLYQSILQKNNQSSIADTILEDMDLIKSILNYQGVLKIGSYIYKIAYDKKKVFVMHENNYPAKYDYLLNGIIGEETGIKAYSTENDVIEMVENGFLNEAEYTSTERWKFLCWSRSGATADNNTNGFYFNDNSAPDFSVFANCHNVQTFGKPSTNTRLKLDLEYVKIGVFFTLFIKGKIQRENDNVNIEGDLVWRTCDKGEGESNWNIDYKVFYRGKCKGDQEVSETNVIRPFLNNENKARKVFWERTTGLNYYCLSATCNIFTDKIYRWNASETLYCVTDIRHILTLSTPRLVNTIEVHPVGRNSLVSNTNQPCE